MHVRKKTISVPLEVAPHFFGQHDSPSNLAEPLFVALSTWAIRTVVNSVQFNLISIIFPRGTVTVPLKSRTDNDRLSRKKKSRHLGNKSV